MTSTSSPWLARPAAAGFAPAAAPPGVTCDAVVLLAGVVRPTEWHRAIGRSLLDLPVDQERSLLDLWHAQTVGLSRALAPAGLTLRVQIDHASPVPVARHVPRDRVRVAVGRDPRPWRGSGGVLRDVADDFPDDDARVVVAHAAQVPLVSLRAIAADLAEARADAAIMTPDRGPCGSVALVRCACLRGLPPVGFCDFHEQALPIIAERFVARAVPRPGPIGLPVRTRSAYVHALRQYHRARQGLAAGGPMAEDWKPAFGIIEPGAAVHPSAQVLDSVVLGGARVERDAVLVRSVVCPGAVVRSGRVLVDQLVHAPH